MGVHPRIMLDIFNISWNWTHLKFVGGNLLALILIVKKNNIKIVSAHIDRWHLPLHLKGFRTVTRTTHCTLQLGVGA